MFVTAAYILYIILILNQTLFIYAVSWMTYNKNFIFLNFPLDFFCNLMILKIIINIKLILKKGE